MVIGIDASRANIAQKTGTEWYSWHIIRELVPRLSGHTIRLYTREPLTGGLENLGPNVQERVLQWRLGFLWSHVRLSWEIFWHAPDILFVPADTIPLVHPKNTVTTIHDVAFERMPELYGNKSVQRRMGWLKPIVNLGVRIVTLGRYGASELDYHRWSVRHALRSSRTIISVSEFTKQELVSLLGANPEYIIVTHQGVIQPEEVAQEMRQTPAESVKYFGIRLPYFLYNGRLERKKNIIPMLEGFLAFRNNGGTAQLVLIGNPGVGFAEISAWLEAHADVRESVIMLGWQPTAQLWELMSRAAAYLFLSAYEGFGRPPLEAASCGTPSIVSAGTSLPEVLGEAALFVDPKNPQAIQQAMQSIILDPALRARLVAAGQQQVKKFTWSRVADQTVEILLKS